MCGWVGGGEIGGGGGGAGAVEMDRDGDVEMGDGDGEAGDGDGDGDGDGWSERLRARGVRKDALRLVERVIGVVRRRRSLKAVETYEQVRFLVGYVEWLRGR